MGGLVTCLAWPQMEGEHGSAQLAIALAGCLPPEQTRFLELAAARSYHHQQRPMRTWAVLDQEGRTGVPILLDYEGAVRPLEPAMCSDDLYWQLVGERTWESDWEGDAHHLGIVISWPQPYPTWHVWREGVDQPSAVALNLHRANLYRECGRGTVALDYIVSLFRGLRQAPEVGHAIGYIMNQMDPSPVNAFMVWHRDIGHFATDLAWAMAASAGRYFYLDPRLGGIRARADSLPACAREAPAGRDGQPDFDAFVDRMRAKGYTLAPPRLTAAVYGELARHANEVAAALSRMSAGEIQRIGAACSTCILETLDAGGFLWTPDGVFACVDELYLLLAEAVLAEVG